MSIGTIIFLTVCVIAMAIAYVILTTDDWRIDD